MKTHVLQTKADGGLTLLSKLRVLGVVFGRSGQRLTVEEAPTGETVISVTRMWRGRLRRP